MQHFKYATLRKLHINPDLSYLKLFLKSNIKFLFTYPSTIYYSQRYNAGEKFMLMDTNIFPYFYNPSTNQKENNDPINISLNLLTATTESYILSYPNLKHNSFSEKQKNLVTKKFNDNFKILNNIINIRSEDSEKLDLPVAVYARMVYSGTIANSGEKNKNSFTEENFIFCVKKFLEKIEYADTESLSLVIFALSNFSIYNKDLWEELIANLEGKSFIPEFTQVSPKAPHVFRYEEKKLGEIKSELLDEFGNLLFLQGYLPVYFVYTGLLKAEENGIECGRFLKEMLERFPGLDRNVEKFENSI